MSRVLSWVAAMSPRPVSYGWIVVGAAAAVIGIGMGALFSLGVFLVPIERSMGLSRGAISSVALSTGSPWASDPSAGAPSPIASVAAA